MLHHTQYHLCGIESSPFLHLSISWFRYYLMDLTVYILSRHLKLYTVKSIIFNLDYEINSKNKNRGKKYLNPNYHRKRKHAMYRK